jgi:lipopolysaccharide/colanic/teichoic acid biosynthesis glycosyltransferase
MATAATLDPINELELGERVATAQFGTLIVRPGEARSRDDARLVRTPAAELVNRALKRTLDIAIAATLLIVLSPLLALIVVLIQVESPGTPFYRARRAGYRGRPLAVIKFRKMRLDARGLPLTLVGDGRLTRIGAFMARTRIDEIPQLWNVLRGQMSLVGPRPEDPQFVALHEDRYEKILSVRPGITGWSQLAFAAESRILNQADPVGHYVDTILPAKVGLDCKYAERTRVSRDLATLIWTAVAMLSHVEVSVNRGTGRLRRRRRRTASRQATWRAVEAATADVR